jgi:hypothetical protein
MTAFSMKSLRKRLSNARHYPTYPGRWGRPDTTRAMWLYYWAVRALRAGEFRKRQRAMDNLTDSSGEISPERGYLQMDMADRNFVGDCIGYAKDILEKRIAAESSSVGKPFLWTFSLSLDEIIGSPVEAFITNPEILLPVAKYLGGIPIVGDVAVWHSPNDNFAGRSQNFHFDSEDLRQVKCFVLLDDVDTDTGPFTLIGADDSRKVFAEIEARTGTGKRNQKVDDEVVAQIVDERDVHPMVGHRGTVAMVDTTNCLHFGSRPGQRPRNVMMIQFLSPASAELPVIRNSHTRSRKFSSLVSSLLFSDTDQAFQRLRMAAKQTAREAA